MSRPSACCEALPDPGGSTKYPASASDAPAKRLHNSKAAADCEQRESGLMTGYSLRKYIMIAHGIYQNRLIQGEGGAKRRRELGRRFYPYTYTTVCFRDLREIHLIESPHVSPSPPGGVIVGGLIQIDFLIKRAVVIDQHDQVDARSVQLFERHFAVDWSHGFHAATSRILSDDRLGLGSPASAARHRVSSS